MKTSIKTLIKSSFAAIVLSTTLFSSSISATEVVPVKVSRVSDFKRISVKGNVEITLIQRSKAGVTYADDNIGSAKVFQDGNNLKISSSDKGLTKIIVYVNDIFRIEASENAIVKTEGKLTTKFLQIFLNGNAHADINTSTEGLYTVIKDNADLKLSGSTDSHTLVMGKTQKLTIDKFAALNTNMSSVETVAIEKEIASIN